MSKTLAEMRKQPPKSRPERSVTVCLAPHLVAEVQALTVERAALSPQGVDDGKPSGPPRRAGQGLPPRLAEIRDRLVELLDEMAEHEGELRVRANLTDGAWRVWTNAHPVREEGEPGYDRDMRVAYGFCNADDLLDDLAAYVYSWNGEPLAGTDYEELIEPNLASPDKAEIAQAVVAMYESRLDFQRWRNDLSVALSRSSGSSSPNDSGSPTSDSTDGNPEPSNADTTSTATE